MTHEFCGLAENFSIDITLKEGQPRKRYRPAHQIVYLTPRDFYPGTQPCLSAKQIQCMNPDKQRNGTRKPHERGANRVNVFPARTKINQCSLPPALPFGTRKVRVCNHFLETANRQIAPSLTHVARKVTKNVNQLKPLAEFPSQPKQLRSR